MVVPVFMLRPAPQSTKELRRTSRGWIVINDLDDRSKRDLDDLPVGTLDFYARLGQRLCRFQALHRAANARAVVRHYFDVVFLIERLKGRQGFGYFHVELPLSLKTAVALVRRLGALGSHVNTGIAHD